MTSPLPNVSVEEEECGICYLDYCQERKRRSLAACHHVICSGCLESLASMGGDEVTCPFCRAPSPLPSDDEEGAGTTDVTGRFKWFKRLYRRKSKAGSRRRGSMANEDLRDMVLICSYFM
ncbi:RING finger protein 227 [Hyla sarda]|uniref:RING finger protein 227 n=1 Tax=Hyla sarda TaxID=327740 RepID=UPI0024C46991|nr:RING finger protein 227 [Hyla sarda]